MSAQNLRKPSPHERLRTLMAHLFKPLKTHGPTLHFKQEWADDKARSGMANGAMGKRKLIPLRP